MSTINQPNRTKHAGRLNRVYHTHKEKYKPALCAMRLDILDSTSVRRAGLAS